MSPGPTRVDEAQMTSMSSVGLCFSQGPLNLSTPYQSIQLPLSHRVTPVTALEAQAQALERDRQAQELPQGFRCPSLNCALQL